MYGITSFRGIDQCLNNRPSRTVARPRVINYTEPRKQIMDDDISVFNGDEFCGKRQINIRIRQPLCSDLSPIKLV